MDLVEKRVEDPVEQLVEDLIIKFFKNPVKKRIEDLVGTVFENPVVKLVKDSVVDPEEELFWDPVDKLAEERKV